MVEILKIISPVDVKNRIPSAPKPQQGDAIFNMNEPDAITKDPTKGKKVEDEKGPKQELLKNLNREIFLPLLNQTKGQADGIRKLILYAKLFEVYSGVIKEDFLNELFILPKELLSELMKMEEGASIFKGDFFDALRVLVKSGNPKLQEAILSILKHFDCYANQDQSLKAIVTKGNGLLDMVSRADRQVLSQQMDKLNQLLSSGTDNYKEIAAFLKNELVPTLRMIGLNYPPADRANDQIMSMIHYIVRYDKADPQLLKDAFDSFVDQLRPMFSHLTDEDVSDMKQTLLKDAETAKNQAEGKGLPRGDKPEGEATVKRGGEGLEEAGKERVAGLVNSKETESARMLRARYLGVDAGGLKEENLATAIKDDKDIASLLSKALDKDSPSKLSGAAQNLLFNLIQSESPMMPLLHFLIPLRFAHEDTYGEFFVDKECKDRKGEAKQATNIFFTIQSDAFGTFEVDLLAKDKNIELDIKCPGDLMRAVGDSRGRFRETIEGFGYRLTGYKVEEYTESKTIIKRFPHLMNRKVGVDVRI